MNSFKLLATLSLASALALFSSCDSSVKITDGRVPADLITYAKSMTGSYTGQIEKKPMMMTVALDADQKMVVTTSEDLISDSCGSKIGNLKEVMYSKDGSNTRITQATFEFDTGRCIGETIGKDITFDVSGDLPAVKLNLQLLDHYESQQRCEWTGPSRPGDSPVQRCWYETTPWYIRGEFLKN